MIAKRKVRDSGWSVKGENENELEDSVEKWMYARNLQHEKGKGNNTVT